MTLISVIMPVYNAEKFLEKSINSILCQSFKDFELILVNDGSTDSSGEICEKYASLDARVVLYHQENSGVSCARMKGLYESKGHYIIHCDSDDWINFNMLELMYKGAIENNADLVYCDYIKYSKNSKPVKVYHDKIRNAEHFISELLYYKVWGVLWNKLIKRELIFENGVNFDVNVNMWEDLLFVIKCLKFSKKIYYVNDFLYHYNINETSITLTSKNLKRVLDQIYVVERILEEFQGYEKYQENLITTKIWAKYPLLLKDYYYDPTLWSKYLNLSLFEILKSKSTIKVKVLSIIAMFKSSLN